MDRANLAGKKTSVHRLSRKPREILAIEAVHQRFPELVIQGLLPLFWTTAIVWLVSFVLNKWLPDH